MKGNLLIWVFWGLAWFLLPIVQASASPAHDHGTISPFDKQKHGHKLYCELNKRNLSKIFCPHSLAEKNRAKPVIAPDCSGKTSGTLPAFGSYNTVFLSDTAHFNVELVLINQKFTYFSYGPGFFLPDLVDPPPQTV